MQKERGMFCSGETSHEKGGESVGSESIQVTWLENMLSMRELLVWLEKEAMTKHRKKFLVILKVMKSH